MGIADPAEDIRRQRVPHEAVPIPFTGRHRRRMPPLRQCAIAAVVWLAVIVIAPNLHPSPTVHRVALFVHLIALLVGFGAVLLVDWFALRWLSGHSELIDVLRTAQGAYVPIWLGLIGLLASGALLSPELTRLTVVKLLAVLVVALNGVYVGTLRPQLELVRAGPLPGSLLLRSAASAAVSQIGWWTAVVIGFLTSQQ